MVNIQLRLAWFSMSGSTHNEKQKGTLTAMLALIQPEQQPECCYSILTPDRASMISPGCKGGQWIRGTVKLGVWVMTMGLALSCCSSRILTCHRSSSPSVRDIFSNKSMVRAVVRSGVLVPGGGEHSRLMAGPAGGDDGSEAAVPTGPSGSSRWGGPEGALLWGPVAPPLGPTFCWRSLAATDQCGLRGRDSCWSAKVEADARELGMDGSLGRTTDFRYESPTLPPDEDVLPAEPKRLPAVRSPQQSRAWIWANSSVPTASIRPCSSVTICSSTLWRSSASSSGSSASWTLAFTYAIFCGSADRRPGGVMGSRVI
mmetsp:Transcript_77769/g.137101  ORF Transcript_77769/g.137101 Transcript_77769/m.137101 type:complete len:315 (+) Transcript_77769:333-1277(+)